MAATDLLPPDVAIVRSFATDSAASALARGPRGSLLIQTMPDLSIVTVCAASLELSESLMQDIVDLAPDHIEPETVPLRTWHLSGGHVISHDRRIEAPACAEIARNYPLAVRTRLQRLFDLDGGPDGGRLILWHGEPGTGKTTALRGLLRAARVEFELPHPHLGIPTVKGYDRPVTTSSCRAQARPSRRIDRVLGPLRRCHCGCMLRT